MILIQTDEQIKLINNQLKGALVIETVKITRILIFGSKNQVDHSKHRNKKRIKKCHVLIFEKRHMKEEKDIASMDFAEYLRKSDVSENIKVY